MDRPYPTATVACFDPTTGDLPRRQLDAPRLANFLRRLAGGGAPAVLIGASTGWGHVRTRAELEAFFEAAADVDLGPTQKMALVRPEDGIDANRRLLARLKATGYAVVFIRPGTDLPPTAGDGEVVENLAPLVSAAADIELPIGLYSISDVSGVPLSATAAAALTSKPGGENIVAIKVTEANYEQSTQTFLEHPALRKQIIVQGWDPHLARALRAGSEQGTGSRCGITSGAMSFALHQYLYLLDAAARDDWAEVARGQEPVTALFASMQDDPGRFADLQRAKFIMGLGHPLTGTVSDDQVERVFACLESIPDNGDRNRLARSLDLMEDGPYHDRLAALAAT